MGVGVRGQKGKGVLMVLNRVWKMLRGPCLAVRLTQTIKTAQARIQNFSELRNRHLCI